MTRHGILIQFPACLLPNSQAPDIMLTKWLTPYGVFEKLLIGSLLLLLANCTSLNPQNLPPLDNQLSAHGRLLLQDARKYQEQGKHGEAAAILLALKDVFPADPEVAEALSKIPENVQYAARPITWLGANKIPRTRVQRSFLARTLWYIPDRLLDLTDVVSIYVDAGPQVGFGVWATQAVKVNLYSGLAYGIGFGPKKTFLRSQMDGAAGLGPVGVAMNGENLGMTANPNKVAETIGKTGSPWRLMGIATGVNTPSDPLYQGRKDYYAIGARAGGLLLGVEVNFHPLELLDLLAGFAGFDPLNDDLSTTEPLEFGVEEGTRLSTLRSIQQFHKAADFEEFRKNFPRLASEAEARKYQEELKRLQTQSAPPAP